MGIWYCTREDVKSALDINVSARDAQVDRSIDDASRSVEDLCRRRFYPERDVRYFDWPDITMPGVPSWRLWLGEHELAEAPVSLSSGGLTIPSSAYNLDPQNGPPFDRLELKLSSASSFGNSSTYQRDIAMDAVFGYDNITRDVAQLATTISSASATTAYVTDSSSIGVGSLLTVDAEKMVVSGRSWTTTGDTLSVDLTAEMSDDLVPVADGTLYAPGELLLAGSERMLVSDVAGNSLVVERAQEGSTLATHSTGTALYAPRKLTVERGQLGTTAVGHVAPASVKVQVFPSPVVTLTIAEAINTVLQEQSGYARTVGSGDSARNASGAGLEDARKRCLTSHGRQFLLGVV